MSYEKPDLSHLSDNDCRRLVADICRAVWYGLDGWNPDNECEISEIIYLLDEYEIKCVEHDDEDDTPYVVSTVTGEKVYLNNWNHTLHALEFVLEHDEVCKYGGDDFEALAEERLGVQFIDMAYGLDRVIPPGHLVVWVSGTVKR